MTRQVKAWLQLLRLPNLFTVPGDPLCGIAIAMAYGSQISLTNWLLPPIAALLFYAAGLIQNDRADLEEDCAERPERPLPSGRVPPLHAAVVQWLLFAVALACCAISLPMLLTGALLLGAISFYNITAKKHWYGGLVMGSCRSLSFLLGVTSASGSTHLARPATWTWSLFLLLYIAAICLIAKDETKERRVGPIALLPACCAAGGLLAMFVITQPGRALTLPCLLIGTMIFKPTHVLHNGIASPATQQKTIGTFIQFLLPLQMLVLMLLNAPWYLVVACAVAYCCAGPFRKHFYAS